MSPSAAYAKIWSVVRRIPRGRVATYGQVAALAGFASQPRLAGYALHALPDGDRTPWHRVVAAGGRIALPEADGRAALQRALLRQEGVAFRGARVDLERCGFSPRQARTSKSSRSARGRKAASRRAGDARERMARRRRR